MSDEIDANEAQVGDNQQINAMPTKAFFVEMFTRDIPLEQAVLDLVDNSLDGARRLNVEGGSPLSDRWVKIDFDRSKFRIADNCGGFTREAAINYAFRFGRPRGADVVPGSIGRFGVGMKRALFKFGSHFIVQSATSDDEWAIEVDVPKWQDDEFNWHFPWRETFDPQDGISREKPGTEIIVKPLHYSVGETFRTKRFQQQIINLIKTRHRSFVKDGVCIEVNGERVQSLDLFLISGAKVHPAVWTHVFEDPNEAPVSVRVVAGVGDSAPREAGWYVICNGRIILFADRRDVTGWGAVEENAQTVVPAYHGQYARFRGVVTFDSSDSRRIPWNTTKTDVDQDNDVWRETRARMIDLMRPVITFLNEVDDDIEEYSRDKSPLVQALKSEPKAMFEALTTPAEFSSPDRSKMEAVERQNQNPILQER